MNAAAIAYALGGHRVGSTWLCHCLLPTHGKGRGDHHPSLSIRDADQHLLVHCFTGCDPLDVLAELRDRGLLDHSGVPTRSAVIATVREKKADPGVDNELLRIARARRIWGEAVEPRGTSVENYLQRRGLALTDDIAGRVLRLHRALPWRDDEVTGATDGNIIHVQAMVAALRSVHNDELAGVHCTALTAEGTKREPRAKRMRGCARDVAVKLDADEDVTQGLAIAEGIETALSARALGHRPVWAVGSRGAIETFPILAGIESLTIARETDDGGANFRASNACARRWSLAGREVLFITPKIVGDLDDVRLALERHHQQRGAA